MTTEISLLGGRLRWLPTAPRPPEDAFWLAASVGPLPAGTLVLDAGCGNGAAGLALGVRQPEIVLHGIDLQAARIAEATAHAAFGGIQASFTTADLFTWQPAQPFGAIICNPPFHQVARGHRSPNPSKALAHGLANLGPWLQALAQLLAPNGQVCLVLHAALLPELLTLATPYGGTLHTRLLASHPTRPPKRLLACWQPQHLHNFQHINGAIIPIYHTPLRESVLREGQSLACQGYGW